MDFSVSYSLELGEMTLTPSVVLHWVPQKRSLLTRIITRSLKEGLNRFAGIKWIMCAYFGALGAEA